jgi:hypothetical protein
MRVDVLGVLCNVLGILQRKTMVRGIWKDSPIEVTENNTLW